MTERIYQIWLYLQCLNFSIVNDNNYDREIWYGNEEKKSDSLKARKELNKGLEENFVDDKMKEEKYHKGYASTDIPTTEAKIKSLVQIEGVVTAKATVVISTSIATTPQLLTWHLMIHN